MLKNILNKSATLRVAKREWQRMLQRPSLWIVTLVVPVTLFVFLSLIYSHQVVSDIPIAVCDLDNSQLSRQFTRALDATRSLSVETQVTSVDDIRQAMLAGKVQGGIFIPARFQADVKNNKKTTCVAYKNGSNIIISNLLYRDFQTVTQTFAAGKTIRTFEAQGMDKQAAYEHALPIQLQTSSIANPGYSYTNYLLPGLLPMILLLCIVLVAALVMNSEHADNTFAELTREADFSSSAILLGKSMPYIVIHFINALVLFFVIYPIFHIPMAGITLTFLLFFAALIIAGFALGIAISSIFHNPLLATDVALFLTAPSLIFCGYTFPMWSMPKFDVLFGQILPFTHYIEGMMRYYQIGGDSTVLLPYFGKLVIFIGLGFTITLIDLVVRLRQAKSALQA